MHWRNKLWYEQLLAARVQIEDLVAILAVFEEATNTFQCDDISVSRVIPALMGTDSVLLQLETQFWGFVNQLKVALRKQFSQIIQQKEYIIATLLDSRYKLTIIIHLFVLLISYAMIHFP